MTDTRSDRAPLVQPDGAIRGRPAPTALPPVFIVGSPRSGTTMLRTMLDAHPTLAIPPESHFITSMWRVRRRYGPPEAVDAARMAEDIIRSYRFSQWGTSAEA